MCLRTLSIKLKRRLLQPPVLLSLLFATLYAGDSTSATIYRWVAADGTLSFSQQRPAGVASTIIKTTPANPKKPDSNVASSNNHRQIRAYLDSLAPPTRRHLTHTVSAKPIVNSSPDDKPRDPEHRHNAYHNLGLQLRLLRDRKVLNDYRKRGGLTVRQRAELRQQRRVMLRNKPEYLSKKMARKAATQR